MSKIVTVFGATGRQGGSVVSALLRNKDYCVRAVTRRPRGQAAMKLAQMGVEVVEGDMDEKPTRKRALHGAYGCFCVTKFWPQMDQTKETRRGIHLALSCREAGIEHFIYSGLEHVKKTSGLSCPHFDAKADVEDYLLESDIPFTSVRLASYMENFLESSRPEKIENGTYGIFLPMGDAPLDLIPVAQVGECVHQIFEQREKYLGKLVGLASDRLTLDRVAKVLSLHLHEDIIKGEISTEEFSALKFAGAPDLANMYLYFQSGKSKRDIELTKELNPDIETFEEWVVSHKKQLREALHA